MSEAKCLVERVLHELGRVVVGVAVGAGEVADAVNRGSKDQVHVCVTSTFSPFNERTRWTGALPPRPHAPTTMMSLAGSYSFSSNFDVDTV